MIIKLSKLIKMTINFLIILFLSISIISCGSGSNAATTDSNTDYKRDYKLIKTERIDESILDTPLDFEFEGPMYWAVTETNGTTYDTYSISINSLLEDSGDMFKEVIALSISPVSEGSYEESLAELYERNFVGGVLYDDFRLLSKETIMMHEQVSDQYIVSYTATNVNLGLSIDLKSKIVNFVKNGLDYSITYVAQEASYESYLDVMNNVISSITYFDYKGLRITNDRNIYVQLNERIESPLTYSRVIEDKILISYKNTEKPSGLTVETEGFWLSSTTGEFNFSSNVPGIFKVVVTVSGQLDSEIIHTTLWVTKAEFVFNVGNE
jgi:hypothetical protein